MLPHHLRNLAGVGKEVQLEVDPPATQRALIDALEATYPALRGTVRDHGSDRRRDLVRFFACGQDLSNDPPDQPLPDRVVSGEEPFRIVGAIAGG
jgi:molybdopterin synthase sulfur carrier subunit